MLSTMLSLTPGEDSQQISTNYLSTHYPSSAPPLKALATSRLQVHSQHTIYYSGKSRLIVLPICLYTNVFVLIIQLEVIWS